MADFELDLSELDSEADLSERAAPRRPSPQPSFRPRPAPGAPAGVTQAQLEAALSRVDKKIDTVANGVSTLSTRIGSLANAAKKEADERKKTVDNTNKDLNSKLSLLALLPVLTLPTYTIPPVQIPSGAVLNAAQTTDRVVPLQYVAPQGQAQIAAGSSVDVTADSNLLNLLLPVLAISGSGFGFGSDSTGGFDNNSMVMLALVAALGLRGR